MPVHPRMRGERSNGRRFQLADHGSSPHAWGTHRLDDRVELFRRFIPACLGNALRLRGDLEPFAAPPRMRGERAARLMVQEFGDGSSPHAWGTRLDIGRDHLFPRFIPACVGNAFTRFPKPGPITVHPRMRGERRYPATQTLSSPGSSPHAWGTHQSLPLPSLPPRFIPACVGNAPNARSCSEPSTVHPRMRGERDIPLPRGVAPIGSSPHAWGTQVLAHIESGKIRFIPACVGNAAIIAPENPTKPVHPRMRGERSEGVEPGVVYAGSSPHAWGTPQHHKKHYTFRRFIPACVGNACTATSRLPAMPVHPRMRGERCLEG